ncbi:hypothetical protein [Hoeflea sp.]|uniref:hypothetical protein n=1 Tax=Hoeflea sp. TaxID=1940281 RepID=UPI003B014994
MKERRQAWSVIMDVVITTINEPTAAVRAFAENAQVSRVILIGDKKTPHTESTDRVRYVGVEEQRDLFPVLADSLPFNHYCRKIIGYLIAAQAGGRSIYDTDDDNLPYEFWDLPDFSGFDLLLRSSKDWINIYELFTDRKVWPRGLPLDRIRETGQYETEAASNLQIALIQGLADIEPDVDAVYRLVIGEHVKFEQNRRFAVDRFVYSPFNSQNTYWKAEYLPLMYLPATPSIRFTYILRGYVAQRLIWEQDALIGFCSPTVYQDRNPHDFMTDFRDEIPMYDQCDAVISFLNNVSLKGHMSDDLVTVYEGLISIGVCGKSEIATLHAWLEACGSIAAGKPPGQRPMSPRSDDSN